MEIEEGSEKRTFLYLSGGRAESFSDPYLQGTGPGRKSFLFNVTAQYI